MAKLLAVDLGFARTGMVVLCIRACDYDVESTHIIKTTKSKRVKGLRSSDDNVRRCREITRSIQDAAAEVDVVAVEIPTGGARSAKAMRAMGLASGVVAAMEVLMEGVPFLFVNPTDVKYALTGKKSASKKDMQSIAISMYPGLFDGINKTDQEHVADAIGVSEVVKNDPVIQILRSTADDT